MRRAAAVFAVAFVGSASVAVLGSGCAGPDCDCPEVPAAPEPRGTFGNLSVGFLADGGEPEVAPVRPEQGSAEVTANAVVFRYRQDGIAHEILYDVVPPERR